MPYKDKGYKYRSEEQRKQHIAANLKYNRKIRDAVIAFLGGKCCKCGFEDKRALQIDHVNGGGSIERKTLKGKVNSSTWYLSILHGKRKDVQLLCANCNWIKRYENNEVLHGY